MKANRPAEAAEAYARAMQLDPVKSGMLQVGYGQALIATGKPELAPARPWARLQKGLDRDRENVIGYRYLAQAYGQLGDRPSAELATRGRPLSTAATTGREDLRGARRR